MFFTYFSCLSCLQSFTTGLFWMLNFQMSDSHYCSYRYVCNNIFALFFRVNGDSARALDLVPAETWVKIFEYLNQDELLKSISLVYKNWFQIVSNERKSLTIQGKKNSKNNSKNIAKVQSLVSRFPNLKELILKHKIFWITKESPILPITFRYVQ